MAIPELESGIIISSEGSTKEDTLRHPHSRLMKNMFAPRGIRMVRSMRRGRRSRRHTLLPFETDL